MGDNRQSAVDALRTVAAALGRGADLSPEELGELARIADRLAAGDGGGAGGGARPDRPPWTPGVPVPCFPDVSFTVDAGGLEGTVRFHPVFEGAGDMVHGGFIAAVLDHVLGAAAGARAQCRTASMTVDYRAPVPVARDMDVSAEVERVEGRKIWVRGRITGGGHRCAEAGGLWIAVDSY